MRLSRIALVLLILGFAVGVASAQHGSLRVIVQDDNGPLPGATVVISSDRGYVKETPMVTDATGTAVFPVLRAGEGYAIQVTFPGYAPMRIPNLKVPLGREKVQTVHLSPEITENVIVYGETEVIDLDKQESTTKFTDDFIQDLPVPGRFYQNVLTMAPGVQDDNGDGDVTVHGSRARDFKAVVGNVSNVDPLTGKRMSEVNPNSIEEMEVVTAGAGVEFGRAQGGYARIIQKQGSNDFEGLAEIYYQSHILNGNGATDLSGDRLPKFTIYQPSVQVSGPIIKDKLWYRASHGYIFREDPIDVSRGIEIQTFKRSINSDQFTWQISPRNKLAILFESDPMTIENLGVSSITPSESAIMLETGGEKYSLTWTAPYSPKLLVETTVAFQDHQVDILPMMSDAANNCIDDPRRPSLIKARCFDAVTGEMSGSYNREHRDHRQRFSLVNQATIYGGRFWGMNHEFKLGLSIENERYYRELTVNPSLTRFFRMDIEDNTSGGQADITRQEIYLGRFTVPRLSADRATGTNWGIYLQDQIKPMQNLTITAGLRLDREVINSHGVSQFDVEQELADFIDVSEGADIDQKRSLVTDAFTGYADLDTFRQGIADQIGSDIDALQIPCAFCSFNSFFSRSRQPDDINLANTNFSPALHVAWDPWSNGKTKFSAGWGRHFNNTPLVIPLTEINPPTADIELNCKDKNCRPAANADATPSVSVVDRNLGTPFMDEWVVGVERELWTESSVKLTYINRKYKDQFQDIDLNHVPGDYGRCVVQTDPKLPAVVPITDPSDPLFGQYPNGGDGIIDDCVGHLYFPDTVSEITSLAQSLQRPDGIPDLYTQNPIWGDIYLIGNFNESNYEAYVLEFNRRLYRSWEMIASYRWSQSFGNGEDFNQAFGDDRTLLEDEYGYQSSDRRHEVKVSAMTITPWDFRFGVFASWYSGLPYSIMERQISKDAIPPVMLNVGSPVGRQRIMYTTGVRNDQRNKSYWNIDVKFTKEIRLPSRMNLQISAEVFNLLNDGTYIVYNPGLELGRQINGVNESVSRFGRQFQLGAKLSF